MKKYMAVFEVPDEYTPRFLRASNADGWFKNEQGETIQVSANLQEVTEDGGSEKLV